MTTIGNTWLWLGFGVFVVAALIVDFVVLRKEGAHKVGVREAALWSAIWVALSLVFAALLWWWLSSTGDPDVAKTRTIEFLTGYLIEKSLAVDNIFLFLTIFTYFSLPAEFQKRALMIGIVAAIVLRTVMIFGGAYLIEQFHWILYVFGAFLVVTGIKMWITAGKESSLDDNAILKLLKRVMRVSPHYDGERFFTMHDGVRMATPLLLVVVAVGIIDVIFAVDSIPAIFAITEDPFIVLTSNIFAVLGLRAMFFLLADLADRFHLLPYGLAVILLFVGTKMLIVDVLHIPPLVSLGVIVAILGVTVWASLKTAPRAPDQAALADRKQ